MSLTSRVVIDTNTLVSATLMPGSVPRQALDRALTGTVLISRPISTEYAEVLRRPRLNKKCSEGDRLKILDVVIEAAEVVEIIEEIRACRDPKDDMVLELAVNGDATCIVSGDADLLTLHPFRGIPILTPRQFLDQSAESPGDPPPSPTDGL